LASIKEKREGKKGKRPNTRPTRIARRGAKNTPSGAGAPIEHVRKEHCGTENKGRTKESGDVKSPRGGVEDAGYYCSKKSGLPGGKQKRNRHAKQKTGKQQRSTEKFNLLKKTKSLGRGNKSAKK